MTPASFETVNALMQEFYGPQLKAQQQLAVQMQKEMQAKWNALPWYTKRYRRTKGWIRYTRRSVGEFIAGEKFE